jgi:hypothetical protein
VLDRHRDTEDYIDVSVNNLQKTMRESHPIPRQQSN